MTRRIPAAILGATGFVGGELLRLLALHPHFEVRAAVSTSRAGELVGDTFTTLAPAWPGMTFCTPGDCLALLDEVDELALFSAAPHGASAVLVAEIVTQAADNGVTVHVVDSSADFRYASADDYARVYGTPHGAPSLLGSFQQGLPEHVANTGKPHAGHPGCFATAALLAAVPVCSAYPDLERLFVSGITGSTGSGRNPSAGTHHPERHSNLYAYKPLAHRHAPEIRDGIAAAGGGQVAVNFVPHSGPFARGIHVTLHAELPDAADSGKLRAIYENAYRNAAFVRVVEGMPRLKDVVVGNYAHIGVAADGHAIVVMCVIDNLVKGAAGGAVQWMNRLWLLPDVTGLQAPAPGWT